MSLVLFSLMGIEKRLSIHHQFDCYNW